jgi:DNA gyrase/topoisomerase IV subunit A
LIKEELEEIRDKYGDARSVIEYSGGDVSIEDLIADENVVITISHAGYINVQILPNTKHRIEEELGKSVQRSRFLRTHVCGNKSSVYDVLYAKKENVSGCVFMKSRK